MGVLRRVLYVEAAIWVIAGAALALIPKLILDRAFGQAPAPEYTWVRMAGIQAIGLALLMILVGQIIESRWWWAWAFALVGAGLSTLVVVNAAFGVPDSSSAAFWWILAGALVAMTVALVWGLARAGIERPPQLNPDD